MQRLIENNDPADQFAESFVGGLAHRRPISDADIVQKAVNIYEDRYANLLACFDAHEFYTRLTALATLEADLQELAEHVSIGNIRGLVEIQEHCTAVLWNRSGFKDIQKIPLTPAAVEELQDLAKRTAIALKSISPARDSSAERKAEEARREAEAVERCVNDNRTLDSLSFQRKYLQDSAGRAIYERAISLGRI